MSSCPRPLSRNIHLIWCLIAIVSATLATSGSAYGQKEKSDLVLMARVDSLNAQAKRASNSNLDLFLNLAQKAQNLATRIQYKRGEGIALTNIGAYYFNKSDYATALNYYFRSVDVLKKTTYTDKLSIAYGQIIWMFIYTKSLDKAYNYLKMVRSLLGRNSSLNTLGMYHSYWGQYYFAINQFDRARVEYSYALYLMVKEGDLQSAARMYRFVGDTWLQQGNYTAAIINYNDANKIMIASGNLADVAIIFTRIAHTYQVMGRNDQVVKFELMALKIREKVGQAEFILLSNVHVGAAYMRINRLDSAGYYLKRGWGLADKITKPILLETASRQMFEYYRRKKQFNEAFRFYQIFSDQHLETLLQQNKSEINILEAKRLMSEEETKNTLLLQEQNLRQMALKNRKIEMLVYELIFMALMLCIQFFYSLYRKNSRRKVELQNLNHKLESEIRERLEALQRLRQSEDLYRFLTENSTDVISRLDVKHGRNYISPSCRKIYGYEVEEVNEMKYPYDLIDPEFHEQVRHEFAEMVVQRSPARFRYKAKRKNQPCFWAESYVNPLFDPATGDFIQMISVVRDISERKKTEEVIAENARQKGILLREIHNRVKNNFAVLVSLMSMQRELIHDPIFNRSIADLQMRVKTMSLVHEQLYESQGINAIPFGDYLQNLSMIITNAYQNERINFVTEISPCELPIEMVMPLGLIVNELLTNAYKYAFPGDRSGTIRVALKPCQDMEWELDIQDDGIGLPDGFFNEKSRSMGMQIVHILIQQIEANLGIGSEKGSRFRIHFNTP